jgi:hypothetical protein
MRTFIGFEGQYNIFNSGSILMRITDEHGKCNGKIKKISSAYEISNILDRKGVIHLLQIMRVYKTLAQTIKQS